MSCQEPGAPCHAAVDLTGDCLTCLDLPEQLPRFTTHNLPLDYPLSHIISPARVRDFRPVGQICSLTFRVFQMFDIFISLQKVTILSAYFLYKVRYISLVKKLEGAG